MLSTNMTIISTLVEQFLFYGNKAKQFM